MAFSYGDYSKSSTVRKYEDEMNAHSTYKPSQSVVNYKNQMDTHNANKVAPWTGGTYGQALKETSEKIANRPAFSYNANADALYQQYKDQYINEGRLASIDTAGRAAAMTGGYGNSYATTAASQANQVYLSKLNDRMIDLYGLAFDKYKQEGQDLKDTFGMYQSLYGNEYGEYRDQVADWENESNRLQSLYYNEANMDWNQFSSNRDWYTNRFNSAYNMDYTQYNDARTMAFNSYQQAAQQAQWDEQNRLAWAAQELAERQYNDSRADLEYQRQQAAAASAQKQQSSGGGSNNDREMQGLGDTKVIAGKTADDWYAYFREQRDKYGADYSMALYREYIAEGKIPNEFIGMAGAGAREDSDNRR